MGAGTEEQESELQRGEQDNTAERVLHGGVTGTQVSWAEASPGCSMAGGPLGAHWHIPGQSGRPGQRLGEPLNGRGGLDKAGEGATVQVSKG